MARIVLIAAIPLLVIVLLFVRPMAHRLTVRAYFTNAIGLHPGAPVRVAGVDVGTVKDVRARPELKAAPVEVVMALSPRYELKIPSDSVAALETAGVLGETYVEIDASSSYGPPIGANAILKTKPTPTQTAGEVLKEFTGALSKQVEDLSHRIENCDNKRAIGDDKSRRSPQSKSVPR